MKGLTDKEVEDEIRALIAQKSEPLPVRPESDGWVHKTTRRKLCLLIGQ